VVAEPFYVPPMIPAAPLTADELLHVRIPNRRVELVKGTLVVREPAGGRHGWVVANLTGELRNHVRAHDLGRVYAAETGFTLARQPDTVRAPDVAFLRRERLPAQEPTGFPELAPDLVVEVLSPGDRPGQVLAKVADWVSAGTRLVWVIDPDRRVAHVYRQDGSEAMVTADEALDGEDVVPGFACAMSGVL
jgi:Uma2 family endonuclease